MLFLYNNLLLTATLTGSSAATGFPVANLKNPFRSKVWRTAGATAGTANLVINHGSAKAVTCVALAGYNWLSAPGTLAIEFNASDAWGAPSATETLTWAANPTANGNKGVIIKTFASKSYQYNRLNVVYSPGATPTDWDLGVIFVGTYLEPSRNYSREWGMDLIDESLGSKTIGGQEHFDERDKYRAIDMSFFISTQAQWEAFQTMFNTIGVAKDLFAAFDYANEPDEMTLYGKFKKLPAMKSRFTNQFKIDLSFAESR
jgi:hypothetical protein